MQTRPDSGLEEGGATIHLHLGAHKTATTYIQTQLCENAGSLAANGIAYIPMREFRPWRRNILRRRWRRSEPSHFAFDRRLREWNPRQSRTCIISDENMIGTCCDIVRSGTLYPKLQSKLGTIAGMLSEHPVILFISIRCYASFYAAVYCETLRHGTGCSADTFKQRLDPSLRRWRDVLAEIAELFPASSIVVWPYENFRESQTEIFNALAGREIASQLNLSGDVLRPSLSQDMVDRIQKLGNRLGWFVAGRLVPIFESRMPKEMGARSYDPWTNEERTKLQEFYADELKEISLSGRYRLVAAYRDRTPLRSVEQQG